MSGSIARESIRIPAGTVQLDGDLVIPPDAAGIVVFAHGSGSSRHSPRNRFVAEILQRSGLATLLMDLLTPDEERIDLRTRALRFDIELLAGRLVGASDWLAGEPRTEALRAGLFGASTGGGAALVAAARDREHIHAVVSRGGRPDLAGPALPAVRAPTLLIVGGSDDEVLELNRRAMDQMSADVRLDVVTGASHLFEERGAIEQVADLACAWFLHWLAPAASIRGHPPHGPRNPES